MSSFGSSVHNVLVTGGGLAGISPRLRVDVGQTGFFAGREFRTFREINLATSAVLVFKLVFPVNTIVWRLGIEITAGDVRVENVSSGTEGGTFSETLPVVPRNAMTERPTPLYTPVNTILTGGTYTGGTVSDVLMAKTAGNSNFADSIGTQEGDERAAPPGTYFVRMTAVEAVTGVFKLRWEERP